MRCIYNIDKSALKGHGIYGISFENISFEIKYGLYVGMVKKESFGER